MRLVAALAIVAAAGGVIAWRVCAHGGDSRHMAATPFVPAPAARGAFDRAHADLVASSTHSVDELNARWQETPDRNARIELLRSAARIPDPHGLAFLVAIASTHDPLAAHAAAAIGSMHDSRRARDLARIAASDAPVIVRANAARALALSGTSEQAAELAAIVANASEPLRVRQEAALALAKLADVDTAQTLADTLDALAPDRTDGAAQLRISIIQALGHIHSPIAHDALVRHHARELSATELAFVDRALGPQPA